MRRCREPRPTSLQRCVPADIGITTQRLLVWDVLSNAAGHLTAEQIVAAARQKDPTMNASSVYRSLALFNELGIAKESYLGEGAAAHWEVAHPDEQFHLKCVNCGKVQHHTGTLVSDISEHLTAEHGFVTTEVDLLVTGLCNDCAD